MRLRALRTGEIVAALGAVALAVLLGFRWFELRTAQATVLQNETGIGSLGWFAVLLLVLAIGSALLLALFTVTQGDSTALPVVFSVLTSLFGLLAVLTVAVRLVFQPGLGVGAGNHEVVVLAPGWLGLVAALAILVGGWLAMADERTDSPLARRQTKRALSVRGAPRPAPPA